FIFGPQKRRKYLRTAPVSLIVCVAALHGQSAKKSARFDGRRTVNFSNILKSQETHWFPRSGFRENWNEEYLRCATIGRKTAGMSGHWSPAIGWFARFSAT
ncbi:hypothetical protein, partial [Acidomonas methanolica]|uniref:hypothetical protein n=1 Tax=Acidomonas methanolica TaxID=437 RepID=UPI00222E6C91